MTSIDAEEIRERIRSSIRAKEYRTGMDCVTQEVADLIGQLPGMPSFPAWIGGTLVQIFVMVCGAAIAALRGEMPEYISQIPMLGCLLTLSLFTMLVGRQVTSAFQGLVTQKMLKGMPRAKDLTNLAGHLDAIHHIGSQFAFAIIVGPLLIIPGYMGLQPSEMGGEGLGYSFVLLCHGIQGAMVVFYVFPVFPLLASLREYHFEMYQANPSRSAVVDGISDLSAFILYAFALILFLMGMVAYVFGFFNGASSYFMVGTLALIITPLVALFLNTQLTLNRIIRDAKWRSLRKIRERVHRLQHLEQLDKDQLALLQEMMNLHDRVWSTPNSALNLTSLVNLGNSVTLAAVPLLISYFLSQSS